MNNPATAAGSWCGVAGECPCRPKPRPGQQDEADGAAEGDSPVCKRHVMAPAIRQYQRADDYHAQITVYSCHVGIIIPTGRPIGPSGIEFPQDEPRHGGHQGRAIHRHEQRRAQFPPAFLVAGSAPQLKTVSSRAAPHTTLWVNPVSPGMASIANVRLALHQHLGGQLVDELAVDVGVEVGVQGQLLEGVVHGLAGLELERGEQLASEVVEVARVDMPEYRRHRARQRLAAGALANPPDADGHGLAGALALLAFHRHDEDPLAQYAPVVDVDVRYTESATAVVPSARLNGRRVR